MFPLLQVVVHVFETPKPPLSAVTDKQRLHRPKHTYPNAFTHHMEQKKAQEEQAYMNAHYPHICIAV
jgi:hypothetical protein